MNDELRRASTPILRRGVEGGCKGDKLDLAYLELPADVATSLNRQFLRLSNMSLDKTFSLNQWAFLFGYPAELVPKHEAARRTFRLTGMGLVTLVVPATEWTPKASPDCDFVFEYIEQGIGLNHERIQSPAPEGLSGGSIWLLDPNKPVPVLSAHDAQWVAIQHSWDSDKRQGIGNRVGWFLRLLWKDYPDLRTELDELGLAPSTSGAAS